MVNGEIYTHKALREQLKSHKFNTGSDCEVIAHLVSTSYNYLYKQRYTASTMIYVAVIPEECFVSVVIPEEWTI